MSSYYYIMTNCLFCQPLGVRLVRARLGPSYGNILPSRSQGRVRLEAINWEGLKASLYSVNRDLTGKNKRYGCQSSRKISLDSALDCNLAEADVRLLLLLAVCRCQWQDGVGARW